MRTVIQKVNKANIKVEGKTVASIDRGIVIFLGIAKEDTNKNCFYLSEKTAFLRLFPNNENKMDFNVLDLKLPALVVSQFTLLADCRRGRRLDFFQLPNQKRLSNYMNYLLMI